MLNILPYSLASLILCWAFPTTIISKPPLNPLSSIKITSNEAFCKPDAANPQLFFFTFNTNVYVELADKTTIRADHMIVTFQKDLFDKVTTTTGMTPRSFDLSQIKNVEFNQNVSIIHKKNTITASNASLHPESQQCSLWDNVIIKQASHQNHPAFSTQASRALFNLQTHALSLQGSTNTPVTTMICTHKESTS